MTVATPGAYSLMREQVLERLEAESVEPAEGDALVRLVASVVREYESEARAGARGVAPLRDPAEMEQRLVDSVTGFGPLQEILAAPDIEEVFLEGDRVTYVDGRGRLQQPSVPAAPAELLHVVNRLLSPTDRHLDASSPIVQARVLDGTARLTAVIPPVSDRLSATIRRFALRRESLDELVALGSMSAAAAAFLRAVMQVSSSVLVSGPPGAGKTSLLAALLDAVPAEHCVRCVEEVRELHVLLSPNSSYYEAKPAGPDGRGEVSVRALVKLVLAMRPDRIVVGEVRGAEAFELTRAANAGCGFCCTVHANSARDALEAIVNAALMAGENVTEPVVRKVFSGSIDFVVHLDRDASSAASGGELRRRTMEILAVQPTLGEGFTVEPIFVRRGLGEPLAWTGRIPAGDVARRIESALPGGAGLREICEGGLLP
jgi:pilus assembly protein CpaF